MGDWRLMGGWLFIRLLGVIGAVNHGVALPDALLLDFGLMSV